jgi:hypothetical protein
MTHDSRPVSKEQLDRINQPGEVDDQHNNPERYLATCGRCDAHWRGHAVAHCGCCHLTFTSVTGFDVHRYEGRCRSTDELRDLGYDPNTRGHWRKPIEHAPRHWGGRACTEQPAPKTQDYRAARPAEATPKITSQA